MADEILRGSEAAPRNPEPPYEPPAVETVLDADSLAREVHYAGTGTLPTG